jgi:eukaryotic translation initiation factor 2C
LNKSACPVTNKTPPIVNHQMGFDLSGIKTGLGDAARQAFMQSKQDPQLILVIMPVSDCYRHPVSMLT